MASIWKWKRSGKAKKSANPRRVQEGLSVDITKPSFGYTNDGNTSRRFFAEPEISAKITGVDFNLIHRCKVILETLVVVIK